MAITVSILVLMLAIMQSFTQGYPVEMVDGGSFIFDENDEEHKPSAKHVPTTPVCGSLPHTKCNRTYEKVGGYIEKNDRARVMPELLLNDRDCGSTKNDGHELDWHKFTESIHSLACRCAKIAKEKGYKVFGLQFYGECWSGPSAEASYSKYGKAAPSKSFQFIGNPPPPCDKTKSQECIGGSLINYVYRLKEDVDGGYSNWTEWTHCTKTCGGGVQHRDRTCTNPKPSGNGKDCSRLGAAKESKECAKEKCIPDVDGGYSNWTEWTHCTKTCGGGVQHRDRTCTNPKPSGNGKDCSRLGAAKESKECAKEKCIPDVDGGYSNWTEWTHCTKTCGGGVQHRDRTCTNPKRSGNGKSCLRLGAAKQSKKCARKKCIRPDVDGGYSKWKPWTRCSKTCGGGVKHRRRTCTDPKPSGNGKSCSRLGAAKQSKKCAKKKCIPDVDGGYSKWRPWTRCSKTCGGGVKHRRRTCTNPKPSGNGKDCSSLGHAKESKNCAKKKCIPACKKALDIGIILDGSGSVGECNFEILLEFLGDLITHFDVSANGTHFGFITYSRYAKLEFTMADKRYHNLVDLKTRIAAIRYPGGATGTDKALTMATTSLFTAAGGDRLDKPNLLIVFTDGKMNEECGPDPEVLLSLKDMGVRTMAVGIGDDIKKAELLQIAMDDPQYVVRVKGIDDRNLKKTLKTIVDNACQVEDC